MEASRDHAEALRLGQVDGSAIPPSEAGEAQARDVAIPTEPMTYDQLVKSGYGSRRPDILWVPVRPDSPAQPEQTPFQSCDSHLDSNSSVERPDRIKRQLSDDLDEIRSQEIQSRNKSYSPCSDSVKRGRVTPRSEVNAGFRTLNLGNSMPSNWDYMPEPIMHKIFAYIDLRAQQNCRLVSRYWNQLINSNLKAVQPKKSRIHTLLVKFQRLSSIDFSACETLRNRNLATMAASSMELEELIIGHSIPQVYNKPRVTNTGLESIAKMTTLRRLAFADCNAFTNKGLASLSALTNLEQLCLLRCPRLTEKGLNFLQQLPKLRCLTVFNCNKVSDALLPMIKTMIQLESLHLGQVRITRERLEDLCDEGRCGLRELTVHGVEITPGSLVALHGFKNLMAVGMSACHQIDTAGCIATIGHLTNLRRLNLLAVEDLNNSQLHGIAANAPLLQQLKIVLGPTILSSGVEYLAQLKSLEAVTFESARATSYALNAVSKLTRLTTAEFPGSNTPTELLNALPYLEKLQRLSLSNNPPDTRLHRPAPLWMGILEPLLRCLQLKALDMTYTDMNITALNALLTQLVARDRQRGMARPVLEEICMFGCQIKDENLETMNQYFPFLHCHRRWHPRLPSSTFV